jgi:hypothetical protein
VRVDRLLGLVAVAAIGAASLAPAVAAADGPSAGSVQVSLLPTTAGGTDPRQLAYVVDHVDPGHTIERTIQVSNGTDRALPVVLYPDAATISQGNFVPGAGTTPNALTGWTTVTPASLTIAPGRTQRATITINVPAGAASGEQYGVVFAQPPASQQVPNGPIEINRVGIRIYLAVGTGVAPADFQITSLGTAGRSAHAETIAATVRNTGGVALDISGRVLLVDGHRQLQAGPYLSARAATLAPGDEGQVTFGIPRRVPAGHWDAHASLQAGTVQHDLTTPVTLTGPGPAAPPAQWWLLVAGIVAVLAVLGLGLWLASRFVHRVRARPGRRMLPA